LAQAVQGRNAGTFSRFLAWGIDRGLTLLFTFILLLILARIYSLVPEIETIAEEQEKVDILADGNVTEEELNEYLVSEANRENGVSIIVKDHRFESNRYCCLTNCLPL